MKKQKAIKEFNDFDGFDDLFEGGGPEMLVSMAQVLHGQQQVALDLTKLILEHAKLEKVTKETVFKLYQESMTIAGEQLSKELHN